MEYLPFSGNHFRAENRRFSAFSAEEGGQHEIHLELTAAGNKEPASVMYYSDHPADMILYQSFANRALGRDEKRPG